MKTQLFHVVFTLLLVFMAFLPEGCKRGADDPVLSFRSRKARICSDWSVSSYENNVTSKIIYPGGNTDEYTVNSVNDGSQTTETRNVTGLSTQTSTYDETVSYTFKKNGTWKSFVEKIVVTKETIAVPPANFHYLLSTRNEISIQKNGVWNFTGSVGDAKSKENMLLTPTEVTETSVKKDTYTALDAGAPSVPPANAVTTSTTTSYTNHYELWKIIELRKKALKAVIEYKSSYSKTIGGTISGNSTVESGTWAINLESK